MVLEKSIMMMDSAVYSARAALCQGGGGGGGYNCFIYAGRKVRLV